MLLLAVLALAAALPRADTLVVGTLSDPVSLDPHRATDLVSAAVVANVCETLVEFRHQHARPEPALATTWASVDGRTWTFTLRRGVRFHDGTPLDADAVIANIENLRRERAFPGTASRVGPLVVAITLDRPNAALLATLSQPFYAMQSPRQLGLPAATLVGTGPFRFAAGRPGLVELEANASYWGGPPRLQHVVFRRYRSEVALVEGLLAGEVDVSAAAGQQSVERLRDSSEVTLDSQPGLNVAFLSLNNERRPFDDRRVRQALARAIDRAALVQLLAGHAQPARNPLPPSLWGYGTRTKELPLDRPAARRLLAEAGLHQGFDATLLVTDSPRPYNPAPARLAERIRDDLAQVGVRAAIVEAPSWAEYVARGSRGDFDIAVFGWQADTTDPNDFLSVLLGSEFVGTTNRSRYRSQALDALLKRGRMGRSADERTAVYREVQELFQRDMPWVPLYHVASFTAYRRSVKGVVLGPTGLLRYEKAWKMPPSPASRERE